MTDNIFGGAMLTAALIGLLAALWSKIKTLLWRVASLVVVRFTVHEMTGNAVADYLWRHGKRSRYGERAYGGCGLFVQPADRQLVVAWERVGTETAVFWIGNRPLLAGLQSEVSGGVHLGQRLTLTFLRGTFDLDAFVRAAVDEYNARKHGGEIEGERRFTVNRIVGHASRGKRSFHAQEPQSEQSKPHGHFGSEHAGRRYLGWLESEIGPPAPPDPLGPLAFTPEVNEIVREAERWLTSEKWYKSRRIPWRRGWLFYGQPGTGKSSLARAVAVQLDLALFVFELGTLSDSEFIEAWNKAKQTTPCMVLIEDIDGVFHGRENIMGESGGGLNYGTLLNCISGVEGADGILLVVTTNHVEYVDAAMGVPDQTGRSTRPGRIDRAVELRALDADCRRRVAERILADCPDEITRIVAECDGMTGAQFQERCTQVALARHWHERPAIVAEDAA